MNSRARRKGRRESGAPHPVDVHVGSRLRLRRNELGMSQGDLAAVLGLTYQQVHKYEYASDRISARRLYQISRALGVEVPFFYEGYEDPGVPSGFAELLPAAIESDSLTIRLVDAFQAIDNPELRRRLLDLARTLAGEGNRRYTGRKSKTRRTRRDPRS